jgi:hypothetical protein
MKNRLLTYGNRRFIIALAVSIMCWSAPGAFAQSKSSTSPQGAVGRTDAAICVGSSFNSGGITGPLPAPCTDASNNGAWFTVMNAGIKTSTTTDLFVSPSLVTGLYTNTQIKGHKDTATSETATAAGSVAVRVLLDCSNCSGIDQPQTGDVSYAQAGEPDPNGNGIVYDARIQQLTGTLGEAITSGCLDLSGGTNTCDPEILDLILSTTSAHTFNFIFINVGNGDHTITVQARLNTGSVCYNPDGGGTTCSNTDIVNTNLASEVSAALYGLGSVTVIPVHLGPGFSF